MILSYNAFFFFGNIIRANFFSSSFKSSSFSVCFRFSPAVRTKNAKNFNFFSRPRHQLKDPRKSTYQRCELLKFIGKVMEYLSLKLNFVYVMISSTYSQLCLSYKIFQMKFPEFSFKSGAASNTAP